LIDASKESHLAIISGGLGDIGKATAWELARRGAVVALCDVHPTEYFDLRRLDFPENTLYTQVDVSDPLRVSIWIESLAETIGIPTWIVPNAAIVTLKSALDITDEEWKREIGINLSGGFWVAQAAAQYLVALKRPGRIVFVGSWAAHVPHQNLPAYSVAKAGLRMAMYALALELAPHDILVNEVAPGYVDAGLSGRIFAENPAIRERAAATVPVGRLITPEEVARQVGWLCDPANRHQTGSVILMDGGLSLVSPASNPRPTEETDGA
jgi:glucose 1-dehydrogenase